MSQKVYQVLFVVMLLLIWMNSMMNAEISSSQSGFFVSLAESILGVFQLNIDTEILSLLIRKLAHFTEYLVLGYLLWKGFGFSLLIGVLFILLIAGIDESIQIFSDGRTFSWMDIFIDGLGGLFGLSIFRRHLLKKT